MVENDRGRCGLVEQEGKRTRTGNPILTERAFGRERGSNGLGMTLNGTINKTFLMLILIVAAAYYTW
ncbi:MAG: hypothetical protein K0R28_5126, partial [Paenibacillus sp.]|nr:hypothetical protein [Paenibacillus sp.]